MKAFIAGVITFSLLIGAIITNTVLITKRADEILDKINELPDSAADADAAELVLLWKETRSWAAVTIHQDSIDDIDDTLSQLALEISLGNDSAYLREKVRLREIVERLRRTESFSLSRIF